MTSRVKWPARMADYVGRIVVGLSQGKVTLNGRRAAVRLRAAGASDQHLEINGVQINNAVRSAVIEVRAGELPAMALELAVFEDLDAEGYACVTLSNGTRDLLNKAGWVPPEVHSRLVDAATKAMNADNRGWQMMPREYAKPWEDLDRLLSGYREEAVRRAE